MGLSPLLAGDMINDYVWWLCVYTVHIYPILQGWMVQYVRIFIWILLVSYMQGWGRELAPRCHRSPPATGKASRSSESLCHWNSSSPWQGWHPKLEWNNLALRKSMVWAFWKIADSSPHSSNHALNHCHLHNLSRFTDMNDMNDMNVL